MGAGRCSCKCRSRKRCKYWEQDDVLARAGTTSVVNNEGHGVVPPCAGRASVINNGSRTMVLQVHEPQVLPIMGTGRCSCERRTRQCCKQLEQGDVTASAGIASAMNNGGHDGVPASAGTASVVKSGSRTMSLQVQ